MKKVLYLVFMLMAVNGLFAQSQPLDSVVIAKVTVDKDPRLDILEKFQVDMAKMASRFTKGYRLFVLKTNNRDYAMKVRAYLLQNFPDEKVIMTYQSPFIKMKFGDFESKDDAEKMRSQIIRAGVVTSGIYVVPDTIELKPDRIEKDGEF